jgi:hypothetical protein
MWMTFVEKVTGNYIMWRFVITLVYKYEYNGQIKGAEVGKGK